MVPDWKTLTLVAPVSLRASAGTAPDPHPAYLALARTADILFAGEAEAALIVGQADPPTLARRLRELGPTEVIIKLGVAGAYASIGQDDIWQNSYPVDVVDTVGAGDAFVAGYLSALLENMPTHARLERAALAGAFACTTIGDWESAPTALELREMKSTESVSR